MQTNEQLACRDGAGLKWPSEKDSGHFRDIPWGVLFFSKRRVSTNNVNHFHRLAALS